MKNLVNLKKNYIDIRGVCKFQINEIFEDLENRKNKDNFILNKLIKNTNFGNLDLLPENLTDPFLGQLID